MHFLALAWAYLRLFALFIPIHNNHNHNYLSWQLHWSLSQLNEHKVSLLSKTLPWLITGKLWIVITILLFFSDISVIKGDILILSRNIESELSEFGKMEVELEYSLDVWHVISELKLERDIWNYDILNICYYWFDWYRLFLLLCNFM